MMKIDERLAIVETRVEQLIEESIKREAAQQGIVARLALLQKSIDDFSRTITHYRGFIGGILFAVGAVGAFIAKFGDMLWEKFHG